jgi:undecaprenyl-diphosphatase
MDETAKRHRNIACLLSAVVLFLMVALVGGGLADNTDGAIRMAVHDWTSPGLTWLFETLSAIGSVATNFTMTAVVALMHYVLGQRWSAVHLIGVMGAAVILSNLIKIVIARGRPESFFGVSPETYSFPSGHALFSGCFYGFFALFLTSRLPQAWQRMTVITLTILLVAGIGLSRVYLGVHYPTDVIAGFALAAIILCVAEWLSADLSAKSD